MRGATTRHTMEGEAPTAEVGSDEWLRDTDALVFFICGFG